jgi:hypothetical protein
MGVVILMLRRVERTHDSTFSIRVVLSWVWRAGVPLACWS